MRRAFFIFFLLHLMVGYSLSQAPDCISIPKKPKQVYGDHLGNLYLQHTKAIEKYNVKGELLYTFSGKQLGEIEYIDVTNPMKILVFYKENSLIQFLDNTLTLNGTEIDFVKSGIIQPLVAATGTGDSFWIYDWDSFRLIQMNAQLKEVNSSPNINYLKEKSIVPTYLIQYKDHLFMCDSVVGVLMFDFYGNYLKTIPIPKVRRVSFVDSDMILYTTDVLMKYNLTTNELSEETQMQADLLLKNYIVQMLTEEVKICLISPTAKDH